jgi:tripartite-type tricarboxylate transporter receptor subunit TctC
MRTINTVALTAVFSCSLALASAGSAIAQTFPNRPIRLIVPYSVGGGVDSTARIVGDKLGRVLGQPIIIENRGGAGGNIGMDAAARAEPNGYVLLMGSTSLAVNVSLYNKLTFDPAKDFVPVALISKTPNILAVNPKVKANTVQDLIKLAKANPGKLNYSSAGAGTTPHLGAELFNSMAGVQITHVPYKGAGPAVTAALAGEVEMIMSSALTILPHLKTGKLRALAMTGTQRSPAFPDIPTVSESGLPGFEVSQWYGIVAPAGTPKDVVDKLNKAIVQVVRSPEMVQTFLQEGSEPIGSTPQEFSKYLHDEIARWSKTIKPEDRIN